MWRPTALLIPGILFGLMAAGAQAEDPPGFAYLLHCAGCHLEDGAGSPPDVPDLRLDMDLLSTTEEGRSYLVRVPGVSQSGLSDAEVVSVMNWMFQRFYPDFQDYQPYTAEEVIRYRAEPLYNPQVLRDQLLPPRS